MKCLELAWSGVNVLMPRHTMRMRMSWMLVFSNNRTPRSLCVQTHQPMHHLRDFVTLCTNALFQLIHNNLGRVTVQYAITRPSHNCTRSLRKCCLLECSTLRTAAWFNDRSSWVHRVHKLWRKFYRPVRSGRPNKKDRFVYRRVRQGDPCSPHVYLICAEILSSMLHQNNAIKGITLNETEILLSQFADDTTLRPDGSEQPL